LAKHVILKHPNYSHDKLTVKKKNHNKIDRM